MLRLIIITFLLAGFFVSGCRKENGKREYEMQLLFDNGDVLTDHGIMSEKKLKQYNSQAVYTTVFNDYLFLKVNGKFICSGQINKGGVGDIYFEGSYTRKGRAYMVDNGYFEVIRRDVYGNPLPNSILTGRWTLKRK